MQCAARGWECVALNTLACSTCQAVVKHLPPPASHSDRAVAENARRFEQSLVASHLPACPWRVTHSPESFTTLRPCPGPGLLRHVATSARRAAQELQSGVPLRLETSFLESLSTLHMPSAGCTALHAVQALQASLGFEAEDAPAARAVLLAITGWSVQSSKGGHKRGRGGTLVLSCATCQTRVAFTSSSTPKLSTPTGAKRRRSAHQHRDDVSDAFHKVAERLRQAQARTPSPSASATTPAGQGGQTAAHTPSSTGLLSGVSPDKVVNAQTDAVHHPLVAHRSCCPWVTPQRLLASAVEGRTAPTPVHRSVAEYGQATVSVIGAIAAAACGGQEDEPVPYAATTSAPGWLLYLEAVLQSQHTPGGNAAPAVQAAEKAK